MSNKIGVVYATGSGMLRRVIVPDNESQLDDPAHVQPGETMLRVSPSAGNSKGNAVSDAHEALKAHLGKDPPSPRCAVVDADGNVVDVIAADPDLDDVPGHALVLHDSAGRGWKWTKKDGFKGPPVVDSTQK